MYRRSRLFISIGIAFQMCGCVGGTIPPDVETVATGLNNPIGIVVMDGGSVVVSESGAGRVVSISADGEVASLITDFERGTFFPYDIGPMGLVVRDDGALIVGGGGSPIGMELVSFFDAEGQALETEPLMPVSGGNFQGMAIEPVSGDLFFASANTDRIHRAVSLGDGSYDFPVDAIANTLDQPIGRTAPSAIVFEADGSMIVGFADFVNGGIARITLVEGDVPMVETLHDSGARIVTALAIRPSDGVLFFAEFDPRMVADGRIGRIRDDGTVATFSEDVVGPSGLAFDSDDALYVTVLGSTPNADAGAVLRMTIEATTSPDDPADDPGDPTDTLGGP